MNPKHCVLCNCTKTKISSTLLSPGELKQAWSKRYSRLKPSAKNSWRQIKLIYRTYRARDRTGPTSQTSAGLNGNPTHHGLPHCGSLGWLRPPPNTRKKKSPRGPLSALWRRRLASAQPRSLLTGSSYLRAVAGRRATRLPPGPDPGARSHPHAGGSLLRAHGHRLRRRPAGSSCIRDCSERRLLHGRAKRSLPRTAFGGTAASTRAAAENLDAA